MATVAKDFKIKSGLVVVGANATVGGYDVLKKDNASDEAYIVGLVTGGGGTSSANVPDTVVLRDGTGSFAAGTITAETGFSGDLTGNVTGDVTGTVTGSLNGNADTATALESSLTIDLVGDATGFVEFDGSEGSVQINVTLDSSFATDTEVATAKSEAITAAETDATTKANAAQSAAESFATAADTTLYGTVTTDIATAKSEAISAAAVDATTKANTAESNATSYTDSLIGDATVNGTSGNTVTDRIATAVSNLVDSAPATLDTLNELAAALQDNPDVISDLQTVAAGKQNTLTAGSNIDITNDTISVVNLASTDISDFNTAAVNANTGLWDNEGAAQDVQDNLDDHASLDVAHGTQTAIVGVADTQTLTNKTIDGSSNTVSNIANASLVNDSITVNGYSTALGSSVTLDTGDVMEGAALYFTDERAQDAVATAIANGTHANITITYDDAANTISFEAENGVADSTTADLLEDPDGSGTSGTWYFTDARAVAAIEAVVPNFTEIDVNSIATQVAASSSGDEAQNVVAYSFASADYRSAKFLVKVAYGAHTQVSEVLLTLDTSDNIAITEYAIVGTNGDAAAVSADVSAGNVRLIVTPNNNGSTIKVSGTLLV